MPRSCYLKAKRFKVVFVNKIIVLVLVIKARCLAYRTYRGNKQGMIGVDLHGSYKTCCLLYLSGKYSNRTEFVYADDERVDDCKCLLTFVLPA